MALSEKIGLVKEFHEAFQVENGLVPTANNNIYESISSVSTAITPTTGTFISIDDDSNNLWYWRGSSWVSKGFEATTASTGLTKVGLDIRLEE